MPRCVFELASRCAGSATGILGRQPPSSRWTCRAVGRSCGMGAKYFPTIKDLKASQRFQQKQRQQPRAKKVTVAPIHAPKRAKKPQS